MKIIVLEKISSTKVNPCLEECEYPNIESLEANLDDSSYDIYLDLKKAKELRDALDKLISDIEMVK